MFNDDELFGGSPQKKYFDIIFNANRNLVEQNLTQNLSRIAALEYLIEDKFGKDIDIDRLVNEVTLNNQIEMEERLIDLYINGMGDILTQNE